MSPVLATLAPPPVLLLRCKAVGSGPAVNGLHLAALGCREHTRLTRTHAHKWGRATLGLTLIWV